MKRITLLMAAIICLATTAVAQISENQTLSTTLWKQGIATCAHYTAHARGFAKKIDEIKGKYPQGYTLDDLNEVYSNQGRKWEKIYNEFKKEEDKNGTINDLKELVTPQIWKLVEPDFQAFMTEHPEAMQDVPAQPADKKVDGENAEGEQQDAEAEAQDDVSCHDGYGSYEGLSDGLLQVSCLAVRTRNTRVQISLPIDYHSGNNKNNPFRIRKIRGIKKLPAMRTDRPFSAIIQVTCRPVVSGGERRSS